MLNANDVGPMIRPWIGVWDLVADTPEAGTALVALLFTMAMSGIALAVLGSRQSDERQARVPVVVRSEQPRRRVRRRRR